MISVIIPVSDPKYFENHKTLLKYKEINEVIILDSSLSLGNIEDRVNGKRVLVLQEDSFDHGSTRNKGASLAKGDILLFMTQDARPYGDNFTAEIISSIDDQVKAVYGKHVVGDDQNIFEKFEREFVYNDNIVTKSWKSKLKFEDIFVSNVCFAVEKKIFELLGGFPENVICSEELIISFKLLRSGYKVMYNPNLKVWHFHNESSLENFRRWFDVGVAFSKTPYVFSGFRRYALNIVISELLFLIKNPDLVKNPNLMAEFFKRIILRFLAFEIGKRYKILNNFGIDIRNLSKNKSFWNRNISL